MCFVTASHVLGLCGATDSSSVFFFIVFFFFFSFLSAFFLPIDRCNDESKAGWGSRFLVQKLSPRSLHGKVGWRWILLHKLLPRSLNGKKMKELLDGSCELTCNLMAELRNKIMNFREILSLSPMNESDPMNKLLMDTVRNLHIQYPAFVSCPPLSELSLISTYQGLLYFYEALGSVQNSWSKNFKWRAKFSNEKVLNEEDLSFGKLGNMVLERLSCVNEVLKEVFELMDKDHRNIASVSENFPSFTTRDSSKDSCSGKKVCCKSPHSPTSLLPDTNSYLLNSWGFENVSSPSLLRLPLRLKVKGKLKPIDVKRFSIHMLPYISNQNMAAINQINKALDTLETNNFDASIQLKAMDTEAKTASHSKAKMEKSEVILKPLLHEVTKKPDDPSRRSIKNSSPSNSLSPIKFEAAEFALPKPQTHLPPLKCSSIFELLTPNVPSHSLAQLPHSPVAQQIKSVPPPPPPVPPMPNYSALVQCLPKQSSSLPSSPAPPLTPTKQCITSPYLTMLPSKESINLHTPSVKHLPEKDVDSSSPPTLVPLKESTVQPPKSLTLITPTNGSTPPPPPPLSGKKALRPKKANTKLKRSSQMGSMYRLLKGKVEGSPLSIKGNAKMSPVGAHIENRAQGMADALVEMTKRSAYFRQIEEDVEKYAKLILDLKHDINSFQTKNMNELLKFHKYVELQLEDLTDETQVLARFEQFPMKKLESLRSAATLYSRLDGIATNLESWKIKAPVSQEIEKVECYFNKIKGEIDSIERTRDDDSKQFQSHNVVFDYSILLRIKESMVDVSSNCIETALMESKRKKVDAERDGDMKHSVKLRSCSKILWAAFQLAFRVYKFAGGQDDRADELTCELAREIETYAKYY